MNFIAYFVVLLKFYGMVDGEVKERSEPLNCTKLLIDNGCNDGGHLLTKTVCLDSDYQQFKPPNSFATVYIGFLRMPMIMHVKENMGRIKIYLDEMIFLWEDPRIKANLNSIEKEKLPIAPISAPEKHYLLVFPYNNICDPGSNAEDNFKIWTPINQRISIKEELSRETEGSDRPWGIQGYGLKFTDPLNESKPLMFMRMKIKVTVSCEFEHVRYPMDTQRCEFRMFTYPMNPLNILLGDLAGICNQSVQLYERNGFQVTSTCVNQTDGLHGIGIDFALKRNINKYLFQYYLPSAIIVIVSQLSFFIPLTAIPGRIGLVVTQFLALTNIFINEQVVIQYVSYYRFAP